MFQIIALFLTFFRLTSCDWVSEWMSPIQEQFQQNPPRRSNNDFLFEDETLKLLQGESTERSQNQPLINYSHPYPSRDISGGGLKAKLKATLQNAKMLAETLKKQIKEVSARENALKEAIVNGRFGVSSVLVTPLDRQARFYTIRDGIWTQCRGELHQPETSPMENDYDAIGVPKCHGEEVLSEQDPCVFNSIIKYETVPTVRRVEYAEDDFLCLKRNFNNTLERYMSVPRQVINETCQNGLVRSLEDNYATCGLRVISEYTYYPFQGYGANLPLEYCAEPDGSCKLIMAWHISNATVENFEFLKNEIGFKNYFIKAGYVERVL